MARRVAVAAGLLLLADRCALGQTCLTVDPITPKPVMIQDELQSSTRYLGLSNIRSKDLTGNPPKCYSEYGSRGLRKEGFRARVASGLLCISQVCSTVDAVIPETAMIEDKLQFSPGSLTPGGDSGDAAGVVCWICAGGWQSI